MPPSTLVLAAIGIAIIAANWLPRLVSGREPAAAALLIGLGWAAFQLPGMPLPPNPVANPHGWELASAICLVVGLFGVGLRIDNLANRRRWLATARLLALAMPICIVGVALLGWAVGGMTLAGALLLGALLAPTDPVLASDVQVGPPLEGGEHPVRFTLTTEAALNDGLAFPGVHLALAVAAAGGLAPGLMLDWFGQHVVYAIAVGGLAGAGAGWLLARLVFVVPRANPLAASEAGIVALAGALATYGLTEMLHGYGFVAAFIAGVMVRQSEARHQFNVRLHDFAESIERALTALLLLAFGGAMPVMLAAFDWRHIVIAGALIFVIRPLVGYFCLTGTGLPPRERLVVGSYGIRGIGSIYYLAFAAGQMTMIDSGQLWAVTGVTILMSTIVHGFTAGAALERVKA